MTISRRRLVSGSHVVITDDQAAMLSDATLALDMKRAIRLRGLVAAELKATPHPDDEQVFAAIAGATEALLSRNIGR